jgi:leukotriene-A4 hydrolase
MQEITTDIHSFSRPTEVCVTHLDWKAKVDFVSKRIQACATWTIRQSGQDQTLVLDSKNLILHKISIDGAPTHYALGHADELLGTPILISITSETRKIAIEYSTLPQAEALQWLNAEQTANKKLPFLFTQSQAILARTWLPCQDSPGVRFTYEAEVTVLPELLPLMSASNPKRKNEEGLYTFKMENPIPAYLFALSVGDFSFHPISERCGIYAETSLLEKAVWEFADLENMLAAAEELYGTYVWQRYDVLVMPPSFPFGGMENPRLTFATPTILAGDRSLTSLIAHELAHSWSGNLVTNATWNDFWINEGFTVYFEHRIMEKLYGSDYAEMLALLALQDLKASIDELTEEGKVDDTKLRLNLLHRNPDEAVTDIAYNKGYFFLRSIEEKYGRPNFDAFLKDYFSEHAFQSMDTNAFIHFIRTYYQQNFHVVLEQTLFDAWIFSTGLPNECPCPNSQRLFNVREILVRWMNTHEIGREETSSWSTHEWLHFLNNLPERLSHDEMRNLDRLGSFTDSGNAEILGAWFIHVIRQDYHEAYPQLEKFLVDTGRRKFLSPLYQELIKTADGQDFAKDVYKKARPSYHYVATHTFDKLFKWE